MTPTEENQRFRFGKAYRLLTKEQYDRVFAANQSAADHYLIVYVCPNDLGYPRLGLVVSRKVGKAHLRNRWKRLLREAFRLNQHQIPAMDIICIPRCREEANFEMLSKSLCKLIDKIDRRINKQLEEKTRDGKQC